MILKRQLIQHVLSRLCLSDPQLSKHVTLRWMIALTTLSLTQDELTFRVCSTNLHAQSFPTSWPSSHSPFSSVEYHVPFIMSANSDTSPKIPEEDVKYALDILLSAFTKCRGYENSLQSDCELSKL